MKRVRVLVANRPRLMREMLMATIADQTDIEIVGEVVKEEDLNEGVEQTQPDVLILALEEPEQRLGQCGFLLGRYRRMRILALAPEQNRGIYYWAMIDIRNRPVESPEAGVLSAIRSIWRAATQSLFRPLKSVIANFPPYSLTLAASPDQNC